MFFTLFSLGKRVSSSLLSRLSQAFINILSSTLPTNTYYVIQYTLKSQRSNKVKELHQSKGLSKDIRNLIVSWYKVDTQYFTFDLIAGIIILDINVLRPGIELRVFNECNSTLVIYKDSSQFICASDIKVLQQSSELNSFFSSITQRCIFGLV